MMLFLKKDRLVVEGQSILLNFGFNSDLRQDERHRRLLGQPHCLGDVYQLIHDIAKPQGSVNKGEGNG